MTRRAALGGLAAAGAGFALFGPRGERAWTSVGGRIVLDYWEKWTRHEGDAMEKVIAAFNASQDRIHVRYVVTSDIGQKSLIAIGSGNPPDLIGLYSFNIPFYAEAGAIIPIDELAPKFGVTLDRYAAGVRQVMQHKGRWWATVNTAGSIALYYNRELFRKVGLDPDRPPSTIAELDEAHRKLAKIGDDGRKLERVGFLHREPGWWSWLWAYHFGGAIYSPEGGTGGGGVSLTASDANIRAMEWMQSYARDLGVDRVKSFQEGFGNYFTPENPFLTGKVGMIVQGPWVANLVQAFKPDLDYGVAPFPTVSGSAADQPVGLIDTDVLVIPRNARHPEASMEFIAWTQRQDMSELLATAHCKPSPLAVASDEFLSRHPNRGIRVHYAIFGSNRAYIAPKTPTWQQFKDEFDSAVQRVWRLEAPPREVMGGLQSRTQAIIDHAAAQRRRRNA